jgi:prevent-host-death family protein
MPQVTLQEAETQLAGLIRAARNGEEVVITDHDQPVARIVSVAAAITERRPRRAGSGKGKFIMAPDFDAPLEEFKEYME